MALSESEHRFPCAQCGASLRFAPGQQSLSCEYCGHAQEIPRLDDETRVKTLQSLDYHEAMSNSLPPSEIEETTVLNCGNCGAQVEFEPDTHSAECPFCATPVVADTGTNRHIKPQAVIPFALTERDAHDKMRAWLRGRWFAPDGLKKYARSDGRLNGLYVPYWAFDTDTRSSYTGERGTYYYVTVPAGKGKTRRERRVRWSRASGRVARKFYDVLVMASRSLPRPMARRLEPWTLSELELYSPQYLSGFRAEAYTVELPEGFEIARERMDEVIRSDIRRDIGGDEQRIHSVNTAYADERFKHLLLPVWMAAYRYRDKSYRFIVNGQTGRVQGERPWSVWKIAGAVVLAIAFVALAAYIAELGG